MTHHVFSHVFFFFFSSRRRHTRSLCDWSSDVCSSDLGAVGAQEPDDLARPDMEREVVHDHEGAEPLRQMLDADRDPAGADHAHGAPLRLPGARDRVHGAGEDLSDADMTTLYTLARRCPVAPTIALDAALAMDDIAQVDAVAGAAETVGFAALWAHETKRNPFIQLALAARATSRILLGTGVAIAFPRSPTVMAHLAWDLAALSGGRFILGLGTQVKAHIERRFGLSWDPPAPKLREYVDAVRAG